MTKYELFYWCIIIIGCILIIFALWDLWRVEIKEWRKKK